MIGLRTTACQFKPEHDLTVNFLSLKDFCCKKSSSLEGFLRVFDGLLAAELEALRAKIADLEARLEEKSQLVLRLEEDLLAADSKDTNTASGLEKAPSDLAMYFKDGDLNPNPS